MSGACLVSQDPGMSGKYTKNQVCNYMEKSQPGSPRSRLTGLRFFHVIAFTRTAWLAGPAISNHITPL